MATLRRQNARGLTTGQLTSCGRRCGGDRRVGRVGGDVEHVEHRKQCDLFQVHRTYPGEHRLADLGTRPGGVPDGAGAAPGAAGVGERAAHKVAAVGVLAAVRAVVGFPPATGVLAQWVVALMGQDRHLQERVDPVQGGVPEASLACSLLLPAMVCRLISRPAQQMRAAMRVRLRAVENLALIPTTAPFVHMQDEHTRIRDALSGCDPSGAVGPCRADRGSGLAQRFSFVLRAVPGVVSRDRDALGRGSRRSPE